MMKMSFNTSHVTLYQLTVEIRQKIKKFQYISCYSLSKTAANLRSRTARFNTSHVTLYQNLASRKKLNSRVSIHLMLLFIGKIDRKYMAHYMFQYISCYSLSKSQ